MKINQLIHLFKQITILVTGIMVASCNGSGSGQASNPAHNIESEPTKTSKGIDDSIGGHNAPDLQSDKPGPIDHPPKEFEKKISEELPETIGKKPQDILGAVLVPEPSKAQGTLENKNNPAENIQEDKILILDQEIWVP
ncbi:MAG: hypothetical protein KC505_01185 [Myxococcales bacterium]|nr:hypothetical protein [Myxococcales bacterium]USN50850.1 MAG: hypothetical protein H6731_00050 [Myxococcales bacterium]